MQKPSAALREEETSYPRPRQRYGSTEGGVEAKASCSYRDKNKKPACPYHEPCIE